MPNHPRPVTNAPMDLVLCHTTADFDALGAAVGLTRLKPGAKIVLTGGAHPAVRDFLALHRDEYALIERRSVNPKKIRSIAVVDTQLRDRTGIVQIVSDPERTPASYQPADDLREVKSNPSAPLLL